MDLNGAIMSIWLSMWLLCVLTGQTSQQHCQRPASLSRLLVKCARQNYSISDNLTSRVIILSLLTLLQCKCVCTSPPGLIAIVKPQGTARNQYCPTPPSFSSFNNLQPLYHCSADLSSSTKPHCLRFSLFPSKTKWLSFPSASVDIFCLVIKSHCMYCI